MSFLFLRGSHTPDDDNIQRHPPTSPSPRTAANTGVMTFMDNMEVTQNLPVGLKTVAASVAAGLFRIFLMPVDTVKVRWVCDVYFPTFFRIYPHTHTTTWPRFCDRRRCKSRVNFPM